MYIRRATRRHIIIGLSILIPIIIGILIGYYSTSENNEDVAIPTGGFVQEEPAHLSDPYDLDAMKKLTILLSPGRIHLIENCTAVTFATTLDKTEDISRGYAEEYEPRPDPYDIIENLVEEFNISVEHVTISTIQDNIYHANLLLKHENKLLALDTKPSDAIAIAARFNTPLYMNAELFTTNSHNICEQPT